MSNPTPQSTDESGILAAISSAIGGFGVRHRWLVLGIILAITAGLTPFAAQLEQDDDVIKFLPADDPDVVRFQEIGERFHGLNIAIVGIEANDGTLFTVPRLTLIRDLDTQLKGMDGVSATTTITELPDVTESKAKDGEELTALGDLVGELPDMEQANAKKSQAFLEELETRVMSRDHLVGALISTDGTSTILLAQISPDVSLKETADAIRVAVKKTADNAGADVTIHYGGAPFIGSYAAEHTRRDLLMLSPWVCAVVILIMLLTARSVAGVAVALSSVGIGIVWVMGGIELAGRSLTLVSSSLPVLLVALGSAYSVHLLASTLAHLDKAASGSGPPTLQDRIVAIEKALVSTGPPVIAAGLTTAAGFVSFLVMNITPMQEFGLLMSIATMVIIVLTLVFVPAALALAPLRAREEGRAPVWALAAMTASARAVASHKIIVLVVVAVIVGGGGWLASSVRAHTDINSLFAADSEPVRADNFLQEKFGGSLYLQIEIAGDMKHPAVLQQVDRIASATRNVEGISFVQSVSDIVMLAASATTGEWRIPPSRNTAAAVGELVNTDPSARLLVDDAWEHSLLQARLSGFDISRAREIATEVERLTGPLIGGRTAVKRKDMTDEQRALERRELAQHLSWIIASEAKQTVTPDALAAVFDKMDVETVREDVATRLQRDLVADPIVLLKPDADFSVIEADVSRAISQGTLDLAKFTQILEPHLKPEELENPEALADGLSFVFAELEDVGKGELRSKRVEILVAMIDGDVSTHLQRKVEAALWSLENEVIYLPAASVSGTDDTQNVSVMVSGYPMVYAGMNASVEVNQVMSLLVSGLLVFFVLAFFFRSPLMSAVALVPAVVTLVITFAIMGAFRIPMDVGTSMIAAIALGVGIDYAVHLLWRHRIPTPEQADARLTDALGATGWGIVINALEVSAGLTLLVFGTVVPMRNFGLLTATAMLVSAIATLLLIPALTRWVPQRRTDTAPVKAQ